MNTLQQTRYDALEAKHFAIVAEQLALGKSADEAEDYAEQQLCEQYNQLLTEVKQLPKVKRYETPITPFVPSKTGWRKAQMRKR